MFLLKSKYEAQLSSRSVELYKNLIYFQKETTFPQNIGKFLNNYIIYALDKSKMQYCSVNQNNSSVANDKLFCIDLSHFTIGFTSYDKHSDIFYSYWVKIIFPGVFQVIFLSKNFQVTKHFSRSSPGVFQVLDTLIHCESFILQEISGKLAL